MAASWWRSKGEETKYSKNDQTWEGGGQAATAAASEEAESEARRKKPDDYLRDPVSTLARGERFKLRVIASESLRVRASESVRLIASVVHRALALASFG